MNTSTGTKENPIVSYEALDDTGLNYSATHKDGQKVFFTGPDNPMFAGLQTTALPVVAYVPPEPPPEQTDEQKLAKMLEMFGLTKNQLRAALDIN